jgi:hypothetical protein
VVVRSAVIRVVTVGGGGDISFDQEWEGNIRERRRDGMDGMGQNNLFFLEGG